MSSNVVPGLAIRTMCNFYNDFAADFQVITEEKVVVLVDAAFNGVLNWNNASLNFLFYTLSKTSRKSLQGLTLTFAAEKLEDCAFAVGARFALEGYGFTFCFPAYDS